MKRLILIGVRVGWLWISSFLSSLHFAIYVRLMNVCRQLPLLAFTYSDPPDPTGSTLLPFWVLRVNDILCVSTHRSQRDNPGSSQSPLEKILFATVLTNLTKFFLKKFVDCGFNTYFTK